jgi:glycosyltransferase involved in cell wall biosynthesis
MNNENLSSPGPLIGFVSNSAWSVFNFRIDVIRHLLSRGYRVLVVAPDDEYSARLVSEGCEYIPIDFNNRTENPVTDLNLYQQLKRIYSAKKPALLFHFVIKPNIYGSLAARDCRLRSIAVITGLGYSFAKKNWLYKIVRELYRRALRHSCEVWFLNNEDAKAFITERIVDIKKIKVLPGEGVNTGHFIPDPRPVPEKAEIFSFLMSTRLLRSKGVEVYVDAARILRNKGYQARFELIGFFEKSHPDSITEAELKSWRDEGLIDYHGFAHDVRPFLQKAACFIFPSFYNEGVPRCLMEAASMELPIITSLNRGCKEVVLNNSNGYICNLNDPFDLADKMEKMFNLTQEERDRMGKNGRALVIKKFNVAAVIREYEKSLEILF